MNRIYWLYAQLTETPRRRIALWATLAWLDVRLLQAALTILTLPGSLTDRLTHWCFWDCGYYQGIAVRGYVAAAPQLPAYFPLYPLIAHFALIGGALPWQAALLLPANLAALAALVLVGWLTYHETQHEGAALVALLLLVVSPLGVFLSAMYSDSLFLALVAGAWLAARTYHWHIAGLILAAAIITRPFGAALAIALLVEFVRQRQSWRALPWLLVPPLVSTGAFLLALWRVYGTPLATFLVERQDFGRVLIWPWETATLTIQEGLSAPWLYPRVHLLLDMLPPLLCLLCVAVLVRKWPASFSVYVALVVLLCLISPVINLAPQYALVSAGRYCYAAMPLVLIPVGCWLTRWPRLAVASILAASLVVQLALVALLLHGGWLV